MAEYPESIGSDCCIEPIAASNSDSTRSCSTASSIGGGQFVDESVRKKPRL